MEIVTEQQIWYSNKGNIPLVEVAEAMIALDGIMRRSPFVLERLLPGLKVLDMDVFVAKIESGSLWETVIVKLVFGGQHRLDRSIEEWRDKLHVEDLLSNKGLVAIILASTILSSGIYFSGKSPGTDERRAIEVNQNVILNMGAEITEMDAERFRSIIDAGLKGREVKTLESAIHFIRPAKRDPGATITFNGNESIRISPETINAYPSQKPEPEEVVETFENVDVIIRATDLDSARRGWAAVVPCVADHRMKLQLDPSIDPEILMAHPKIKANVTILFRETDKGKVARLIYLNELIDPTGL